MFKYLKKNENQFFLQFSTGLFAIKTFFEGFATFF